MQTNLFYSYFEKALEINTYTEKSYIVTTIRSVNSHIQIFIITPYKHFIFRNHEHQIYNYYIIGILKSFIKSIFIDNYHGKNIDKYPIFIVLKNIADKYRYSQKYRKYRIFFLLRKAGCIVFRGKLHTLHRKNISVKYHRKNISPILSIFTKNIDNIS